MDEPSYYHNANLLPQAEPWSAAGSASGLGLAGSYPPNRGQVCSTHAFLMELWHAATVPVAASLQLRLACLPLQQMSPRATEQAYPNPLQAASQDPALKPYRPPSPHSSYRRSASLRNAALRSRPDTTRTSDSPWQVAAPLHSCTGALGRGCQDADHLQALPCKDMLNASAKQHIAWLSMLGTCNTQGLSMHLLSIASQEAAPGPQPNVQFQPQYSLYPSIQHHQPQAEASFFSRPGAPMGPMGQAGTPRYPSAYSGEGQPGASMYAAPGAPPLPPSVYAAPLQHSSQPRDVGLEDGGAGQQPQQTPARQTPAQQVHPTR